MRLGSNPGTWTKRSALVVLAGICLTLPIGTASAQTADAVLFDGKILTVDKDFSVQEALAIGHGQVLATGTNAAMKKLAGDKAKLIDLGGRTVIPGLTDGHIHGIRAALTFGTEVNWIGVPALKDALDRIREAGKTQKPGSWIVVAGGWTEEQFSEKRRPTPREVAEAAPDNPVYIQHLYDWLLLTPKAMDALNIHSDADVTPGGKLELDSDNKPSGVVIGNGNTLGKIFDKLPKPTIAQQVDGSKKFFHEMNSLGITASSTAAASACIRPTTRRCSSCARQGIDGARRLSSLRAESRAANSPTCRT